VGNRTSETENQKPKTMKEGICKTHGLEEKLYSLGYKNYIIGPFTTRRAFDQWNFHNRQPIIGHPKLEFLCGSCIDGHRKNGSELRFPGEALKRIIIANPPSTPTPKPVDPEDETCRSMVSSLQKIAESENIHPELARITIATETDNLRIQYLKIFDQHEMHHKDEPFWWKKQFEKVAKMLFKLNNGNSSEVDHNEFVISREGERLNTPGGPNDLILIGRLPGCDILLSKHSISRLHAIVFVTKSKYYIIDVGSMLGIQTLGRSENLPLVNSNPESRNVLIFDKTETSVISFANINLTFQPKECTVCLDNFRDIIFNCGHFCICDSCRRNLPNNACPSCRAPITGFTKSHDVFCKSFEIPKGYAGNKYTPY